MGASLGFLEVDPFGDRQALEMAAQAVERHLDGAEAYPVASAIDARARRRPPLRHSLDRSFYF